MVAAFTEAKRGFLYKRKLPPALDLVIMPSSLMFFNLGIRYREGMSSSRLYSVCIGVFGIPLVSFFLKAMIYFEDRAHKKTWKRDGMDELPCPHMLSLILQRMKYIPKDVRFLV